MFHCCDTTNPPFPLARHWRVPRCKRERHTASGKITLPVTFGDPENFRTEEIVFDIADTPLPYNGILGRPALAKFMAVSHFAYDMMKILVAWGMVKVKADTDDAIYCVQKLN